MIVILVVAPIEVGQQVLGLLERVGDGALGDTQTLADDAGDQIAV